MAGVAPVSVNAGSPRHTVEFPGQVTTGKALLVTVTSSKALQVPFVTVHLTVALVPAAIPISVVDGEPGSVIVAIPLINVHTPNPTDGTLCVIVKLPLLH